MSNLEDRLPTYLSDTPAWVDFSSSVQSVLAPYTQNQVQKLLALRDVNNITPTNKAAVVGTALFDASAALDSGVPWQDPQNRMKTAAMLGMNFYNFLNLTGISIDQLIKTVGEYYGEQGTPSWWQYLGFLTGTVVDAVQLWDSTAEVDTGLAFGAGDGSTTSFYLRDAEGGFAPNTITRRSWDGLQVLYPSARTNLIGGVAYNINASATVATGFADPAGGTAAIQVTPSATGGSGVYWVVSPPANTEITDSVWLRADVPNVQVSFGDDQVIGGTTTVTLTTYWQRFDISANTGTSAHTSLVAYNENNSTTPFYIAFPQIELGPFASTYISGAGAVTDYTVSGTTVTLASAPASGELVFVNGVLALTGNGTANTFQMSPSDTLAVSAIYDADWQTDTLMSSTARTNLLLYSQSFGTAPWTAGLTASVSATGQSEAPDTSITGTLVTATAAGGYVQQAVSGVAGNGYYAYSIFVRNSATSPLTSVNLTWTFGSSTTEAHSATFNFVSGSVTSSYAQNGSTLYEVDTFPNGWYRVTLLVFGVTAANTAATAGVTFNQAGSIYLWGAQAETGQTSTRYIETQGTTVTTTDYSVNLVSGLVTFAVPPLQGAALSWSGSISGRGNTKFQYLYPAGDARIGTPVWEGGTWYPTYNYNVTITPGASNTNFNSQKSLDTLLELIAFLVPINVVIRNLVTSSTFATFSPALLSAAGVINVVWLN